MNIETAYKTYKEIYEKIAAYGHAMRILAYDGETVAPALAAAGRGKTQGILSGLQYELYTCPEMTEAVSYLVAHADELDEFRRREISEFNKTNEYVSSIPAEEYVEFQVFINEAQDVWHRAKQTNDFELFRPYLEKIFETTRRHALYYKPDQDPYDTLLDMYERGLTREKAEVFFAALKEKLVPLMKRVFAAGEIDDSFSFRTYPIEIQRKFSDILLHSIGVDRRRCAIGETEHPFTDCMNRNDARVTTHYHEDNLLSSMYSVIHEGGHALYDMGSDEKLDGTCLFGGVSMGIHESQSRLFENIIGRSREYIDLIFPKLKELFPEQLADVDARKFWLAVNKSQPSLIRTEADELTYAMHVMVRYELEREIMAGRLAVADLPRAWAEKYREYLGVEVPDDTHGVLQDSHWSGAAIGYFPSYALGSAYGAQIVDRMKKDIDFEGAIRAGEISKITAWLTDKIYRHGCMYDPAVLFENCCGAPFSPDYFVDYLTKKYETIIAELTK